MGELFIDALPMTTAAPSGEPGYLFENPLPVTLIGGASGASTPGATGATGASGAGGSTGGQGATGASGAGGAGASVLLASMQYAPATYDAYPLTSGSLSAVDATNLTISFVAPASGSVIVRLTGTALAAAGIYIYWALFIHGGSTQAGDTGIAGYSGNQGSTVAIKITGLTPGNTYQYDWAAGGSGPNCYLAVQGSQGIPSGINGGTAVMEVWSA